jgi:triacylglycerol lipase
MRALLVALLAIPGCADPPDACADLRARLDACGLPTAAAATCGDEAAAREVMRRLDDSGCAAIAKGADEGICKAADWPCPPPPGPAPGVAVTKYPLVFVSGIDDGVAFDWNPRILRAVSDLGGPSAEHVRLPAWSTSEVRAAELKTAIDAIDAPKVNLVCYAVGGLDCRYLASDGGLGAAARVASITTIATPHRGTRVADAALLALGTGGAGAAEDVLHALTKDVPGSPPPDDAQLERALRGLTIEALPAFNRAVADAQGVYYQSFAGVSALRARTSSPSDDAVRAHCGPSPFLPDPETRDALNLALWVTWPFASATLGEDGAATTSPADGMVSVESAKWGTFRGCLPADHYDVIGQIGHVTRDVLTGFDAPRFYQWLASDLATRGL